MEPLLSMILADDPFESIIRLCVFYSILQFGALLLLGFFRGGR